MPATAASGPGWAVSRLSAHSSLPAPSTTAPFIDVPPTSTATTAASPRSSGPGRRDAAPDRRLAGSLTQASSLRSASAFAWLLCSLVRSQARSRQDYRPGEVAGPVRLEAARGGQADRQPLRPDQV